MTVNIKRLASGFLALALMLGGVIIPGEGVWADSNLASCLASTETVCTLLSDEAMDGLFALDRDLTIDLNGHNITSSTTAKFFEVKGHTLNITGSGSISTNNTTNTGIIRVYGTDSAESVDSTKVTIGENVTLNGQNPIVVYNNGGAAYNTQIDVYGTLNGQNSGVWMIGTIANKTNYPIVNIHDGAVVSASNEDGIAVSAMGYANWNIGEAVITGAGSGIGIKAGVVNIDGATVTGTSNPEVLPPATYNNGINASGAAISIEKNSGYAGDIELNIGSGTFTSEHKFAVYSYGTADSIKSLNIVGGVFSTDPSDFVVSGYKAYEDNGNYYVIADSAFTIAFDQSEYTVAEGHEIAVNANVAPATIGESARTDITYAVRYTNNYELTNGEASVEGNVIYAGLGKTGTYKIIAEDMNGNTAEALLRVVDHGSLEVEDKTLYVNLSDYDNNTFTFANIGVTATGEGITYETENDYNVYVDYEEQTVTVFGDDVVTWFYDGEERGTTTFKTYYVYDNSEFYGVRVDGYYYWYESASDGVTVEIANETIAKFVTMTEQSGDEEYTYTVIAGVKTGETALNYMYDGKIVKTVPIRVYNIATTMKRAQVVGTSQTFTVDLTEGYKVVDFSVSAADSWSSEEENTEKSVEGTINEDGTYTIVVNKMPINTHYGYDENDEEVISLEKSPYAYASFTLEDENHNQYEEGYGIMLFEFAATDEAAEAVDDEGSVAKTNEEIMRELTVNVIAEAMLHADEVEDNRLELTLDDGTRVVIDDVEGFGEAFNDAEMIEAVLTEPKKKAESEINDTEVARLKSEMGSGKTGHRFVDINVELRSGGKVFGRITDLKSPLTVSVSVSDDGDAPSGYTRKYFAVRYHNGQAKKISDVKYDAKNKIVSFGSDEFSTYLIAYTDEKDGDSTVATDSSESKTTGSVTVYETAIIEEAETSGEITESETTETSGTSENKNNNKNSNDSESDKEDSSEGAPVFGIILGVVAVIAVIAFIVAMVRSKER